jgi:hypothetical protein
LVQILGSGRTRYRELENLGTSPRRVFQHPHCSPAVAIGQAIEATRRVAPTPHQVKQKMARKGVRRR